MQPKIKHKALTLVSLFAGCGGSSLGYKQAGYDIRLAVEWDAGAVEIYRRNFQGTTVYHGDIASLSSSEALCLARLKPGELDVLDGSPPCQGFSMAGKRDMGDNRNQLFHEYIRLLKVFQPKMFVMENVSGLIRGKMKLIFAEMTKALKELGYKVSCRVLNAWWYGTPQSRNRLIWIGTRGACNDPTHPQPTVKSPVTVSQSCPWIESLRYDPRGNVIGRYYNTNTEPTPTLLSGASVGGLQSYHFSVSAKPENDPHTPEELKEARLPEHYAVSRALKRVHPDRPSVSLTASDWKAGARRAIAHPYQVRRLTIREAKRLQGFPDTFDFSDVKYGKAWMMIGNSVPPPMAKAIGLHIANSMG